MASSGAHTHTHPAPGALRCVERLTPPLANTLFSLSPQASFDAWRESQRAAAEEAVRAEERQRKVEFLTLLRKPESGITSRT